MMDNLRREDDEGAFKFQREPVAAGGRCCPWGLKSFSTFFINKSHVVLQSRLAEPQICNQREKGTTVLG